MKQFETSHRVQHSGRNMFDLVADVESYPQFVPLCSDLRIVSREKEDGRDVLIADMTVAFKFISETFKSKVTLDEDNLLIVVEYLDGPFRTLHNKWHFVPQGEYACDVEFFIEYELRSPALQVMAGAVFDKALGKLSSAFEARADEIYGMSA